MEEYAVELKNVTKKFKIHHEKKNSIYEYLTSFMNRSNAFEEITILKDLSLSVKKGEMLGILGLNGEGKTTLLKIISQIYTPDSGAVIAKGKVTPFLELGTGFNGELTAKDNIILYGIILGFTKKEILEKIEDIVKFSEFEKFLDTKLKNFSSGMNARLAFSTAISVDPDILLVDEVLSVGDITFQEKSFNKFMEFKKKGKTIIFVSHSIEQIRRTCDRVIWLHEGTIRAQGGPEEIIKDYTDFAEKFHV